MTYRELLNKCKKYPGLFRNNENRTIEFQIKYNNWVKKTDEDYIKGNVYNEETTR